MGFMHKDEYEDYVIQQNATVISAEEISIDSIFLSDFKASVTEFLPNI